MVPARRPIPPHIPRPMPHRCLPTPRHPGTRSLCRRSRIRAAQRPLATDSTAGRRSRHVPPTRTRQPPGHPDSRRSHLSLTLDLLDGPLRHLPAQPDQPVPAWAWSGPLDLRHPHRRRASRSSAPSQPSRRPRARRARLARPPRGPARSTSTPSAIMARLTAPLAEAEHQHPGPGHLRHRLPARPRARSGPCHRARSRPPEQPHPIDGRTRLGTTYAPSSVIEAATKFAPELAHQLRGLPPPVVRPIEVRQLQRAPRPGRPRQHHGSGHSRSPRPAATPAPARPHPAPRP